MLFQDGSLFEQVLILQLLAAHVNSLIVTTIDSVLSNCPFYISLASSKPQTKVKSFKYRIPALKAEPLVYQFPLILSISSRLYGNGHRKNCSHLATLEELYAFEGTFNLWYNSYLDFFILD